jgi:hypothetical protein
MLRAPLVVLAAVAAFAFCAAPASAADQPVFSQSFSVTTTTVNGKAQMSFAIRNTDTDESLTGVSFSDTLPAGLVVADPNEASVDPSCGPGATLTAVPGSSSVTFSGGELAPSPDPDEALTCQVLVEVQVTTSGDHTNTTSDLTSNEAADVGGVSASIFGLFDPTFTKEFDGGAASMPATGSSRPTACCEKYCEPTP